MMMIVLFFTMGIIVLYSQVHIIPAFLVSRFEACRFQPQNASSTIFMLLWDQEFWWISFQHVSQHTNSQYACVISDFRREVDENCALLGYYATSNGDFLPSFRDNLSVPTSWPLKMEPIGCPETSARNCQYSLWNNPDERSSHTMYRVPACHRNTYVDSICWAN
jgi:hypothetical protein